MRKLFILILLTCLLVVPAGAETIYMRDGRTLEGTILRQTRTVVYARIDGRVQVLNKATIRRIVYSNAAKKAEEQRKAAAARKAEEERKAAAARKAEEQRKAAEAKKAEEQRKAAEAKKTEDERKAAEAKKAEDERKAAEAKKTEDERKAAEAKKAEDERKAAEAKKAEDERKAAEAKKAEDERKAALVTKKEEAKQPDRKTDPDQRPEAKKSEPDQRPVADSPLTPLGALTFSAMAPGLGQWKSGRRISAVSYGSLAVASLYLAYDSNRIYRNSLRDYEGLNNPFSISGLVASLAGFSPVPSPTALENPFAQAAYSEQFQNQRAAVDRHYASVRSAGLLFATFYGLNLADAYFFHSDKFGKGETSTTPLGAAGWSAAFPGLGQWRSGRRSEGALYGLLFGVSVLAAYDGNRIYRNAKSVYENTSNPYTTGQVAATVISNGTSTPTTIQLQDPLVAVAYNQQFAEARSYMDRKYTAFRTTLYVAGAVYLWAVADAYFFFPSQSAQSSQQPIEPGVHFARTRFAVMPARTAENERRWEGEAAVEFAF